MTLHEIIKKLPIDKPLQVIIRRAGWHRRNYGSVYRMCDQARKGIGHGEKLLSPKDAIFLIAVTDEICDGARNPVADYLKPKMKKFYRAYDKQ